MNAHSELSFHYGINLLKRWQNGDPDALVELRVVFDRAIAGDYDKNFAELPPEDSVHIGGSVNLMTLNVMHVLYGHDSREFYKGDAKRYVRTTMLTRRLLGFNKLYISWPSYAFSAEAIGQETMYPDRFPPGSDPDRMLITRENWQDIRLTDFDNGTPKIIDDILEFYQDLTGMDPILQITAPYSLAADTYGQEPLLGDLVHDPDFANTLLDHLADNVVQPWCEHFFAKFPRGWVEFSDASGSPFFIGPKNCKDLAIRSLRRVIDNLPGDLGDRLYDANYRGDYVATVEKGERSGRRHRGRNGTTTQPAAETVGLRELTDAKHSICRDLVIRLEDDRVPVDFYAQEAVAQNVPLFAGIGAALIDRNSIEDMEKAQHDVRDLTRERVEAIKTVAQQIKSNNYEIRRPPWPGTIYFEDINSESSFRLVEIIVEEALNNSAI